MSSKPPRLCPVNCRSPNKTPGVTRLPLCWLWVSAGSCPSGRPSQLPSPGPVSARVSPYWGSSHVNMSDISCQYVRHTAGLGTRKRFPSSWRVLMWVRLPSCGGTDCIPLFWTSRIANCVSCDNLSTSKAETYIEERVLIFSIILTLSDLWPCYQRWELSRV